MLKKGALFNLLFSFLDQWDRPAAEDAQAKHQDKGFYD